MAPVAGSTQELETWIAERLGLLPSSIEHLPSDGSQRRFFRVGLGSRTLILIENPGQRSENDSYWNIGRHLKARGVAIPDLYHYDVEAGRILLEDLGERRLQDEVSGEKSQSRIFELYDGVLRALLIFQLEGKEGFDISWCYQGARYDRETMVERESLYFLEAFLEGYCGWKGQREALIREFLAMAKMTEKMAPPLFLMHRDFQSRNILLDPQGRPGIIDFQGARLGPLQYDVASLLLDPYVDLPPGTQESILSNYLAKLEASGVMEPEEFLRGYPLVLLQRNLQILGAFSFLGRVRRKSFFLQWIPKALGRLRDLLEKEDLPFPNLRKAVDEVTPFVISL